MTVEVLAVVAPVGVKIENEVSHALVVTLEQELLELVDDCDEDPDPLVLDAEFCSWLPVGSFLLGGGPG